MIEINGALVEKKLYIGDMAFGYIYGQIYDILVKTALCLFGTVGLDYISTGRLGKVPKKLC